MGGILVTGACGRLGASLFEFLSSRESEVRAVSRKELDLSDKAEVSKHLAALRPDLIFHTAAMTDVDRCECDPGRAWRDNLEATRNLAEAAAALNARLIHFSTDYVFDGQKSSPYIELDSPNPLSVYGKTKLAAERAVSSLVENYVIIRVAWLFGVKGDFVSFVKGEIAQGRSPRLATDHQGSPGYIPDLLAAIQQIAKSDVRGIFHLTNSGYCDRFQMGQEIIRILGSRVEPIPSTGAEIGFIAPRPRQSVLSCRKYEESFGHTLRSWQEALRAYLKNTG